MGNAEHASADGDAAGEAVGGGEIKSARAEFGQAAGGLVERKVRGEDVGGIGDSMPTVLVAVKVTGRPRSVKLVSAVPVTRRLPPLKTSGAAGSPSWVAAETDSVPPASVVGPV